MTIKLAPFRKPSNINSKLVFVNNIYDGFPLFSHLFLAYLYILRVTTIFWKVCVRNRNHKLKWHGSKSGLAIYSEEGEGDFQEIVNNNQKSILLPLKFSRIFIASKRMRQLEGDCKSLHKTTHLYSLICHFDNCLVVYIL